MAPSAPICAHYSAPSIRPALLVHLARSLRNYSTTRPTNDHRPKKENFALRDERGEGQGKWLCGTLVGRSVPGVSIIIWVWPNESGPCESVNLCYRFTAGFGWDTARRGGGRMALLLGLGLSIGGLP